MAPSFRDHVKFHISIEGTVEEDMQLPVNTLVAKCVTGFVINLLGKSLWLPSYSDYLKINVYLEVKKTM